MVVVVALVDADVVVVVVVVLASQDKERAGHFFESKNSRSSTKVDASLKDIHSIFIGGWLTTTLFNFGGGLVRVPVEDPHYRLPNATG